MPMVNLGHIITIFFTIIILLSCKNLSREKKENATEQNGIVINKNTTDSLRSICEEYWTLRFPEDSILALHIDAVLSNHYLTENNEKFLIALKNQAKDQFAFENAINPIFRLSTNEIGLLTFPDYRLSENKVIPISKEMYLFDKFHLLNENFIEPSEKLKFYPFLLDSLFKNQKKPNVYFYTTEKIGMTEIIDLGIYKGQCLEYCEYSIDTTNIHWHDEVLFSSPNKIDLIFESNHKIDSLIKSDYMVKCLDCPNSFQHQKTFARLKGSDNIYFVYADTFPLNNEFDTPSRALILVNQQNEIIYLWYSEIDLFGCSCL